MPEVIVDTSVLQYLHQLAQLELLKKIYGTVVVPQAVVHELEEGRRLGEESSKALKKPRGATRIIVSFGFTKAGPLHRKAPSTSRQNERGRYREASQAAHPRSEVDK